MKSFILCGGMGTRLGIAKNTPPKALIKIGSEPILIHLIKIYLKNDINEIVLCLGYKGKIILDYFLKKFKRVSKVTYWGSKLKIIKIKINKKIVNLYFVNTGIKTATGGRLKIANDIIKNKLPFIMSYCDALADIKIKNLIKSHISSKKMVTMSSVKYPSQFGILKMNNNNTVLKFNNNNPDLNYFINAGFFVINPEALKYVTSRNIFWENQPISKIIKDKNLHCYIHNGFWKNLDTYKDSLILNKIWEKNKKKW